MREKSCGRIFLPRHLANPFPNPYKYRQICLFNTPEGISILFGAVVGHPIHPSHSIHAHFAVTRVKFYVRLHHI